MSESYAYNIDSNQDRDILNQGSIPHIIQYFDKLERSYQTPNIDTTQINEVQSPYSINSTSFAIKFTALTLLIIIFWDFVYAHKTT